MAGAADRLPTLAERVLLRVHLAAQRRHPADARRAARTRPGCGRASPGAVRGDHRLAVGAGRGNRRSLPARLRRRQEDQWPQAAHRRRYPRAAARRAGHRGQRPRPRWRALLWRLRAGFRRVRLVWADGGYAGKLVTWAATTLRLRVRIVKRTDKRAGFYVLPRRWVVERTFSWITRYRRTVRDYERLPQHHETMVYWSMITVMGRRLARQKQPPVGTPAPALRIAA